MDGVGLVGVVVGFAHVEEVRACGRGPPARAPAPLRSPRPLQGYSGGEDRCHREGVSLVGGGSPGRPPCRAPLSAPAVRRGGPRAPASGVWSH